VGTYIKKVLGYGLQMTTEKASEIINKDVLRKLYGMSADSYKEFLRGKYGTDSLDMGYMMSDLDNFNLWAQENYSAWDFITVVENRLDGDDGPETPLTWLVITPPMVCNEWKHNDDAIDYAEASHKYQDSDFQLDFSFKVFNHGMFPYEGTFTNHATGERFNASQATLVQRYLRMMKTESTPLEEKSLKLLLDTLKVSSVEEFHSVIHPAPPQSVLDIAEWTSIFTDDSIARKLRPALLTYWG
jgi:hypothetical protein